MQCRMTGQVVDWKFVEGRNLCYDLGVCLEASTHNLEEISRSGTRFELRRSANKLTKMFGYFSSYSTFYASCAD
jgi:hypothetical protein